MSQTEKAVGNNEFYSIVQGSLRRSVPEGTHDAIRRDWEAGGEKGTKWELVYKAIFGKIIGVDIYDGESAGRKFTNLQLMLDENEDGKNPVLSAGIETRYAQDIMKKLPNIDYTQDVRIRPYAFTPEGEDKTVTGVEITQRDNQDKFTKKVDNFFYDLEAKKAINNFPIPQGDVEMYDKDDWKVFFVQVKKFLVAYTRENIIPKVDAIAKSVSPTPKSLEEQMEMQSNPQRKQSHTIDIADIPFP